jgi:phosphoglycolate phosphatase-like HAD superfamily hydrolase
MLYLFDIDGTLLLSGGAGSRALDRVFAARHGVARSTAGIDPSGKTDPMIIREMFVAALGRPPTAEEIDALLADYVPELVAELAASAQFRLMPAVVEALDFVAGQAGVISGIATGNVRVAAEAKLRRAGLDGRFAVGGYGCDDADRGRLVARAIERGEAHAGRRLPRAEIVVVGDTPLDVAAARANGVRVVAVATGSSDRATLVATGADAVLDTLAELPAWHATTRSPT